MVSDRTPAASPSMTLMSHSRVSLASRSMYSDVSSIDLALAVSPQAMAICAAVVCTTGSWDLCSSISTMRA